MSHSQGQGEGQGQGQGEGQGQGRGEGQGQGHGQGHGQGEGQGQGQGQGQGERQGEGQGEGQGQGEGRACLIQPISGLPAGTEPAYFSSRCAAAFAGAVAGATGLFSDVPALALPTVAFAILLGAADTAAGLWENGTLAAVLLGAALAASLLVEYATF